MAAPEKGPVKGAVETRIFRVDRFRDPGLPPDQRRELEAEEHQALDMSVGGVLEQAKAATGLDDFGTPDFADRMARLLGEVEADGNVWRRAKAQFRDICVAAATGRLKNRHYLDAHPEAGAIAIDRPIIITGLPRSGTTHLENLIAADRRLRHLPVYLGAEAAPGKGEAAPGGQDDPRWQRAQARWERIGRNPVMAAMHEHSPDHACGENELQMPDFASYQWEWCGDVPQWRDHYLRSDQTPHYRYGRTMLQAIAHQFPDGRRWILKGNQHAEQLPALLAAYPDAIVVMPHRDPVAILQSVLTMRGLKVLSDQKHPDVPAHVAYWTARIETMLRAFIRDEERVPEGQRVDLMFHDIVADDIGAAETVLKAAGFATDEQSRADLRDYMAHHPRGRGGRVVYDLQGNFGLDIGELRERFRFYTDRFPVRHEVHG